MRRLALPAVTLLAACSQPEVEATLAPTCGPLDGSAFVVEVPDGENVVRLHGPGAPASAAGAYAIGVANRHGDVTIEVCDARSETCERADTGSFALAPREDGGFGGSLSANFQEAGSRRIAFVVQESEAEPPLCG